MTFIAQLSLFNAALTFGFAALEAHAERTDPRPTVDHGHRIVTWLAFAAVWLVLASVAIGDTPDSAAPTAQVEAP